MNLLTRLRLGEGLSAGERALAEVLLADPDALDRAVEQVYDIIQAARAKTKHNMRFLNALSASLKAGN